MPSIDNPAEAVHIESHRPLLHRQPDSGAPARPPDAVIVPTIRPQALGPAAELAVATGSALVVLCSTAEQAFQAQSVIRAARDGSLATYLPPGPPGRYPPLLTAEHPETEREPSCHADIASKRNTGLLLARLCRWRSVLFLDDDIRDLTAAAVTTAAGLASQHAAAGFAIDSYPDNSVVCHAHRLAGGLQSTFPGGSVLAVDTSRYAAFFPPVYNEDWLYLFDAVRTRSVGLVGPASQLEYQPFARPGRAAAEEFGDLIAEGLFTLLHLDAVAEMTRQDWWRSALERRARLLDDIAARLLSLDGDIAMTDSALVSLAAARKRLGQITALSCLSFVRAWRSDLERWRETLSGLPDIGELAASAKFLSLPAPDSWASR